jgi:tripartite ATP-independent transporter DctM subunit
MDFVLLFGFLFGLLLLGVPIGVCLGCGTLALMIFTTDMSPMLLAQSCFTGLDSFTLLAIPFFVVAGDFMMYGGISRRLLNLFNALIGHIVGGTAAVTTVSCMFFAAISGSGPATVSAIGSFMIPEMKQKNYDEGFAAALTACAGAIGVIIPPSIPFILYAVAVGCSVSDLFLAGVLPGILIGVFLIIVSYVQAKKHGWHGNDKRASGKEIWKAFKDSILALLSPVIILGSIYAGICSPTEAAVAGVVYSFFIGTFVYRELKWKQIVASLVDSVLISGSTLFMVGITTCLGRVLTMKGIPQMLSETLANLPGGTITVMILITVMLLIVGCFMDNISATIILAPLLLPTVLECGLTAVQFGVIMTMLLAIGFITPPYGINLFVSSQLSKVPLLRIAKRAIPLMLAMLLAAVLTMMFQPLTMGLVNLLA